MTSPDDGFQLVGRLVPPQERLHLQLNGRSVSVIRNRGRLYCIDSICYHAAGPLALGDIEEVNGEQCIKCPWHSYLVSLANGSKFYESLQMNPATKKLEPSGWRKKEAAQRVHFVEERGPNHEIYVKLNLEGKFDSDEYCRASLQSRQLEGKQGSLPSSGKIFNPPPPRGDTKTAAATTTTTTSTNPTPYTVISLERRGENVLIMRVAPLPQHRGRREKKKDMLMTMEEMLETRCRTLIVTDRHGKPLERQYTPIPDELRGESIAKTTTTTTTKAEEEEEEEELFHIRVYHPHGAMTGRILASGAIKSGDSLVVAISALPAYRIVPSLFPPGTRQVSDDVAFPGGRLPSPHMLQRALLFAGGTGITALSHVAVNLVEHTAFCKVMVVCCDKSENAAVLGPELEAYAARHASRIRVYRRYTRGSGMDSGILMGTLGKAREEGFFADWDYGEDVDNATMCAWCGPDGFRRQFVAFGRELASLVKGHVFSVEYL